MVGEMLETEERANVKALRQDQDWYVQGANTETLEHSREQKGQGAEWKEQMSQWSTGAWT